MLEVRLIPEYLNVLSNLLWSKKLYMLKVAAWQKAFQIITKKSRKLWSITSREMTGLLPTTEFPNYPQNDSIHCIVREQKSTSVPVTKIDQPLSPWKPYPNCLQWVPRQEVSVAAAVDLYWTLDP
jgi:hypothetical protein